MHCLNTFTQHNHFFPQHIKYCKFCLYRRMHSSDLLIQQPANLGNLEYQISPKSITQPLLLQHTF